MFNICSGEINELIMPRDKSANHEKIVAAAYAEFLEYGFVDASIRRIASACDMSPAGLYRHYPSKEDMFAALVEPAYSGLKQAYISANEAEINELENTPADKLWESSSEVEWIMRYIYDHFDSFKLIVCKSKGTKYEDYIHDLSILEAKVTEKYIKELRKTGVKLSMPSKKEQHLFTTANISAIFLAVEHDLTRKEAMTYAKHLDTFMVAGWKAMYGLV